MKLLHRMGVGILVLVLALGFFPQTGVAEIERMVIKIRGAMICTL